MSDGRPHLMASRCSTCVFHPGNRMHLQPGRLAQLIADHQATGTLLICHKTTYGQTEQEAMCRGYFDAYGKDSAVTQIMERLTGRTDWFTEVPPPGDDEPTPSAEPKETHP